MSKHALHDYLVLVMFNRSILINYWFFPLDIKPVIEYGESSAGAPEGSMLVYNEQSQPGPSNLQDGSILHDNSHTQGIAFIQWYRCKQAEKHIYSI